MNLLQEGRSHSCPIKSFHREKLVGRTVDGINQVGPFEGRPAEVCLEEIRSLKIGSPEVGPCENSPGEPTVLEDGPFESGVLEVRAE